MILMKLTKREREQIERNENILSAAEELFYLKGIEKVSLDDIARESEFTKRTIYRYFTCKEDLIFAVALRGFEKLFDTILERIKPGKTGFEKIRLAYYAYYEFFCKFPKLVQLTISSNTVKSRSDEIDVPYRQKFINLDNQIFQELIQIFIEGKLDGSIRSDLNITQLAISSIFVAVGFFQMISSYGDSYTSHFELNKDELTKFTIEMLIESLRAK